MNKESNKQCNTQRNTQRINKYQKKATVAAILAAVLYALNAPFSKMLLKEVSETMMAAWLYIGAGFGMSVLWIIRNKKNHNASQLHITKKELPYTIGMVVLDIMAPIFLMIGLDRTTAANASLMNNFEIVATSIIALVIFNEKISKRLWYGIGLITFACILLSMQDQGSLQFSLGSIFVLFACICWGLENNCTRVLSEKDPMQIVIIKGFGSGIGSLLIALVTRNTVPHFMYVLCAMGLGFVAYGLSIFFYVYAQRYLGAARTSAYYAVSPFIGGILSLILYRQLPSVVFVIALLFMALGVYFASIREKASKQE
jgi:drug/metabolite transporter (DMT)-like permease